MCCPKNRHNRAPIARLWPPTSSTAVGCTPVAGNSFGGFCSLHLYQRLRRREARRIVGERPPEGELRPLDVGGDLYWRRDGELHQWNPSTVAKLQYAVRTGNYEAYREFANFLNDQDQRLQTIRGLLDFDIDEHESIPISEVEAVEEIWKRFSTGSMSLGALSTEAHEALAIAMNRIGGKAGTGEGGEQV